MIISDHWLTGATIIPSPNCDDRPSDCELSLIVIHCISLPPGEFGGKAISQLFTNCLDRREHPCFAEIFDLHVSAHVLIRRDGTLNQFVPFNQRAWHAGESCYQGRSGCNDFSIGIELEGTDDSAFNDVQYRSLAGVTRALVEHYSGLSYQRLAGHSDIAPGRKTDPGEHFDWDYLCRLLGE